LIDNIFEILMLLCFGFAWPFSIHKAYVSRSTQGTSLFFLYVVIAGYIAGMINNVINGLNYVIWFYIINTVMIMINVFLLLRNRRYERAAATVE
jgi:Flp pilus assembly protein TadB